MKTIKVKSQKIGNKLVDAIKAKNQYIKEQQENFSKGKNLAKSN